MELIQLRLVSFLFVLCIVSVAFAQDRQPDQTAPGAETAVPVNEPSLTGKERMGRKWMDEQRIDNCNVPADKRGSKPRSGDCLHSPSG
ncbi:hypothetical protein J6524_15915 [Bradyrhizobium sp. WSM 1738]|uniref:hypothetical protein n=1 Tax=Bradyrhizobium hereditatis TaxID=2821405 RepID=UPI001CE25B36|nr:hypothetical protein [Bradyrhizobium hereditatis]MCA6116373.1 hypothetical protein [Bradyrhizobium hereditatis]